MKRIVLVATLTGVVVPTVAFAQPAPQVPGPARTPLRPGTTPPVTTPPAATSAPAGTAPATAPSAAPAETPSATAPGSEPAAQSTPSAEAAAAQPPSATPTPAAQPSQPAETPTTTPTTPPAAAATPTPPAAAPAASGPAPLRWAGSQVFAFVNATIDSAIPLVDYPSGACRPSGAQVPTLGSDFAENPGLPPSVRLDASAASGSCGPYNPTVTMTIALRPRWNLGQGFQLRGGWNYNYEFTNSDTTTTRNEPRFSDPFVALFYNRIPRVAGFKFQPSVQVAFPVSPESRARTVIFTPSVAMQISRGVEHVLGGDLLFVGTVSFNHPLYQYTTPGIRGEPQFPPQCFSENGMPNSSCTSQLSGLFNVANAVVYGLTVVGEWGHWSPGISMSYTSSWAYRSSSGPQDTPNVRQTSNFSFWLDWNATPWFTLELGYSLLRPVLDADGTYGNPFWAPYQQPSVYLLGNVVLDTLYNALRGGAGAGGVIRTQNRPNRSPFVAF